jgi:hypothetical protein
MAAHSANNTCSIENSPPMHFWPANISGTECGREAFRISDSAKMLIVGRVVDRH